MALYNWQQSITYFMPGEGGGDGPWDDPRDQDESLARNFKNALARQRESYSTTPDPYQMVTIAKQIMARVDGVGRVLMLLDNPLKPIAKRMLEMGPSDRENPGCLEFKFHDLDLRP
ncbi:MAG TPA: hypothetical protein PLO23_02580 [Alphaproteobacteria bacterium]|nr:hypothetical protein [Alphaproteobacteria bacterium]